MKNLISNILDNLIETSIEIIETILNVGCRVLSISPKEDMGAFFKELGVKNSNGKFSTLKKIEEKLDGDLDIYYMTVPLGLNLDDFKKHEDILKRKFKDRYIGMSLKEWKDDEKEEIVMIKILSKDTVYHEFIQKINKIEDKINNI
jgi:hypothetical protein